MTSISHKVGRCSFQMVLPDETRSDAVFDMVSKVCREYLPEMMDQVLNTGLQNSENILLIERVEINLGELDIEDLEGELIRRLKTGLKETFKEAIQQQKPTIVTPERRLWEALAFFLQSGRFPWWFESKSMQEPETILLEQIRTRPAEITAALLQLLKDQVVVLRFSLQFSTQVLRTVLKLLFPVYSPHWQKTVEQLFASIAKRYPGRFTRTFLWETVFRYLVSGIDQPPQLNGLLSLLLRAAANKLAENPGALLAQARVDFADDKRIVKELDAIVIAEENNNEALLESIAESPIGTLLICLRQGRLPQGSRLSTRELEKILIDWVREEPEQARKILAEISGQVNLGLRLTQQFSRKSLQAVLTLLYPKDWPQWEEDFEQLIADTAQHAPNGMSEALNAIIVSEKKAAEAPGDFEQTATHSQVETLLFFLRQGRLPKDSQLTPDELEQTLLLWLDKSPQQARKLLAEISGQANLGLRLTQQFSRKSLQAVLTLLLPKDWPQWGPDFERFIADTAQHGPDGMSEAFMWEIVFRQLVDKNSEPAPLESLLRALIHATSERSAESRQVFLAQVQAVSEHSPLIQKALNAIIISEKDIAEIPADIEAAAIRSPIHSLLFFLEQGRLPQDSPLHPEELEETLLVWLQKSPEQASKWLMEHSGQLSLGLRMSQQFSAKALQAVLNLLFPADQANWVKPLDQLINRLVQRYSDRVTEAFLWATVFQHLIGVAGQPLHPETLFKALVQAIVGRLDMEMGTFQTQIRSIFQDDPRLLNVLDAAFISFKQTEEISIEPEIGGPTAALLFFLREGRIPQGTQQSLAELEQTLLVWLQTEPEQARKQLSVINGQVNLGARLTQQFSQQTQIAVLKALLSDQWEPFEHLLRDIIRATERVAPAVFPEDYFWKTALILLGKQALPTVNLTTLTQSLLQRIKDDGKKTPGVPSLEQAIIEELQKPEYHLFTQKRVLIVTGSIQSFERDQLDEAISNWHLAWKGLSEEETSAFGVVERIRYRIKQGKTAWWDSADSSLEQMFEQLAVLPTAALQQALSGLMTLSVDAWLPSLPLATFEKIVSALWKRDAGLIAAFRQINTMLVTAQNTPYDDFLFRVSILDHSLPRPEMDTRQILFALIQSAAKAAGKPAAKWLQYVKIELAKQKDAGNIYAQAFREILNTVDKDHLPQTPGEISEKEILFESIQPDEPSEALLSYRAIIEADLAALWQFFQTGALPAGSEISNVGELEQIAFRLLEKHPDITVPFLNKVFERQAAIRRLFQYFSPWLYTAMADRLLAPHFETYVAIRDDLFKQLDTEKKGALQQHFYTYLFSLIADRHPSPGVPDRFTAGLIRWISNALGFPEDQIWTHLQWMLDKPDNSMGVLEKILPPLLEQRLKLQKLNNLADSNETPSYPETENQEEMIVVQNAGLVLIAPFLPRLFSTLNLLENQEFTDVEAAIKSVHLLQFLASGQMETPEQLLVFNKVLCGLPVETPVPLSVELTEEEQETCMSMLNAVLSNWEMMKNSSVSNLRGAFLLREGILKSQPDRWTLHIERKTFDIVLEYIPWTISMVKLPWMDKRIEIEWK